MMPSSDDVGVAGYTAVAVAVDCRHPCSMFQKKMCCTTTSHYRFPQYMSLHRYRYLLYAYMTCYVLQLQLDLIYNYNMCTGMYVVPQIHEHV